MLRKINTCFKDLIGCFGLSPFVNGPSPLPRESLCGLFNILTVGIDGTYCDLKPSSPNITIRPFVVAPPTTLQYHYDNNFPNCHLLFRN